MNKRRFLYFYFTVLMLMGSLTACTQKSEVDFGDQEIEQEKLNYLKVAAFEGGYGKRYWEDVTEVFEKEYPGTKVELIISPRIVDIIRPRLIAGDPPDYIYAGDLDKPLLMAGALLPLNDVFESESLDGDGILLKDKILPGFLDYCTPFDDGNIYYAPVNMSVVGLFYNENLFEQKNWQVPATWTEFFNYEERAKETKRALFTYQGIYPIYNQFILSPMLASSIGVDGVNKILHYEKDAWSDPKIRDVLAIYEKIARDELLLEGTLAMNHTQAQSAFLEGKAMFIPGGTWMENEMRGVTREEGFRFGFMPVPRLKEEDDVYVMTNFDKHYIPKSAGNIKMAKEFMKYQYKKENVILNAKLTTAVMPVTNGVELAKPYLSEGLYNCFAVFDRYNAKPLNFNWQVGSSLESEVEESFVQSITGLINGDILVDEWLEKLKKANDRARQKIMESNE